MGTFRVVVEAVGNHGCQRERSAGEEIEGCGSPSCTDCITRMYVSALKAAGTDVKTAHIHHWPDSSLRPDGLAGDVVDNLLLKRRLGRFN